MTVIIQYAPKPRQKNPYRFLIPLVELIMCRILNVIARISAGAEGPIMGVVSMRVGLVKCVHVKCVVL